MKTLNTSMLISVYPIPIRVAAIRVTNASSILGRQNQRNHGQGFT